LVQVLHNEVPVSMPVRLANFRLFIIVLAAAEYNKICEPSFASLNLGHLVLEGRGFVLS